jgi:hypothetical protein
VAEAERYLNNGHVAAMGVQLISGEGRSAQVAAMAGAETDQI